MTSGFDATLPPSTDVSEPPATADPSTAQPRRAWHAGLRAEPGDMAAGLRLAAVLAVTGIPLGVLWWLVAPRRSYLVAQNGAFAVIPESEAAVGADGWLLLLTVITGLLAGLLAWRWRTRRGPVVPVALAVGSALAAVVAWQVGMALAPSPGAAALKVVGATVLGPLQIGAYGVLLIGPFAAVLVYLAAACFTPTDELNRTPSSQVADSVG